MKNNGCDLTIFLNFLCESGYGTIWYGTYGTVHSLPRWLVLVSAFCMSSVFALFLASSCSSFSPVSPCSTSNVSQRLRARLPLRHDLQRTRCCCRRQARDPTIDLHTQAARYHRGTLTQSRAGRASPEEPKVRCRHVSCSSRFCRASMVTN
jgi:hypothetical protein